MAFVRAILSAYQAVGMSPAGALQAAQITPAMAKQAHGRITAVQMEALSAHAMQELQDESLGWSRRPLPWGSYGMLIRASLSAPTLGVALKRWCRHHGLICDNVALRLETEGQGDSASIVLEMREPLVADLEFCTISLLRNLHGVACWLIDSRLGLHSAEFPFPAPPHADVYPLLFPGPIVFASAHHAGPQTARLRLDKRYLDLPLRRDEKALRQMLQRALPLTVPYRRDRLLVRQVRQALLQHAQDTHNAQALAQLLHLSVRTLHRQLKEEGTSLQALKDEVRHEHAKELLQRSHKPIKQVAAAVGFMNEKSFIRAFKAWTGLTPAAFRVDKLGP